VDECLEPCELRAAAVGVEQDLEACDAVDGRAAAAEVDIIRGHGREPEQLLANGFLPQGDGRAASRAIMP